MLLRCLSKKCCHAHVVQITRQSEIVSLSDKLPVSVRLKVGSFFSSNAAMQKLGSHHVGAIYYKLCTWLGQRCNKAQ